MLTYSEENYLKTIFHLSQGEEDGISTNAIAARIETKASSVTDMIKKLNEKKLVTYQKYQGVRLTAEGLLAAKMIVRKHRLWEVFLVEKLGFSWDEVHDVAEELEHIKSEKLINKLEAYLGYPTEDPHGDPIPNAKGEIKQIKKKLLAEIKVHQTVICVGVKDSSAEFLQYLDKQRIALGSEIEILEIEPFDQSYVIEVNQTKITITKKIANNLFVQVK
ncbi:metal-dependent transcriptional regulator [Myroides sp. DW712]|uniref:metal-dependent transcriptional regulator n=1 Tax=Myroides sp. DW712 TaxID=3389800 RepID=UPI00397BF80F